MGISPDPTAGECGRDPRALIRPADPSAIAAAIMELRQGGLAVLPTETVYGLGADATNAEAIARLYAAKGRPAFNPLIAHVQNAQAAAAEGQFNDQARLLSQAFWPGPLTLVVPRSPLASVAELACAGLATIALRAPAHPVMQAALAALGRPIAAPSANRSGAVSAANAADAAADFPDLLVLDAGPARLGLESTIIACLPGEPARLLRPGALPRAEIEALIGPLAQPQAAIAPGMLESHYAPRARLRLDATGPAPREAYLAFGPEAPEGALNLSPSADLIEAAANFYAFLRRLDAAGPTAIAIAPIPNTGLGEALNDRLRRAAAPRS